MYPKWLGLSFTRASIYARKSLWSCTITETFSLQCKNSERKWNYIKIQTSNFHTTRRLNYPIFLGVFGSVLCGYYVRKLWFKLNPVQREICIKWYKQRRQFFHGSLAFTSIISTVYCLSRLQRDPVVNIPRLILFDQAGQMDNAKTFYKLVVQSEENLVPFNDPMYSRVKTVLKKLGNYNREIFQDTEWAVTIISRMFNLISIPNVLILPDKNIIIISDIFNVIKSDDQLTFILAHEMSHEMLLHISEVLSVGLLLDVTAVIFSFFTFAMYSSHVAAILCSVLYVLSSMIFCLYKRHTEAEADAVGFILAAKSCIDLREVLVFWEIMKEFENLSGQKSLQIPLFMDHPSLQKRESNINQMMPKALELRQRANCPPLPVEDPRSRLPIYKKDIEKYLNKRPKILGVRF